MPGYWDAIDQFVKGIANKVMTAIAEHNENAACECEGHTTRPDAIAAKTRLFILI